MVDMENLFCSVSLDIIGLSVFNYPFGSVTKESPVIQAVYNTLREAEHRSTFYFPYWNIPFASQVVPRQRAFQADLRIINEKLNELIALAQARDRGNARACVDSGRGQRRRLVLLRSLAGTDVRRFLLRLRRSLHSISFPLCTPRQNTKTLTDLTELENRNYDKVKARNPPRPAQLHHRK